jgi:ribosome biogenesis SPOUT family RNA methylase Rps3
MCDKCAELDETVLRYRRISNSINDQLTIDRIKVVIADLEAKKAALHPEQKK